MTKPILTPFLDSPAVTVYAGDCIEVMRQLPEASIDAIVTDPPYGLEFMARDWDGFGTPLGFQTWTEAWAREALRILKPGGHLLAFAGTRTYHRMASGVEDAGFEIRDCIAWMYGSGFPKSLDVSKAIDKAAGVDTSDDERWVATPHPVTGAYKTASGNSQQIGQATPGLRHLYAPASNAAREWSGWGTALKPAFEPVVLARKPFSGSIAQNMREHGTGALNIDACRIGTRKDSPQVTGAKRGSLTYGWPANPGGKILDAGRWPANVALDEEAAAMLDKQSGGASRFFYCAKASKRDRNTNDANNAHPTVKPTGLMRWLIRLVTPPHGIILDPFAGSGTTGVAARAENARCILIERETEYLDIIRQRLDEGPLFSNLD